MYFADPPKDYREEWSAMNPEYKKIIEEKYDEYLKAEIEYAQMHGWTDEEIQALLVDNNYWIVTSLVSGKQTGYATEWASF